MTTVEKLNKDLETILNSNAEAVRYVKHYFRYRFMLKCFKLWIIILVLCSLIYYSPFLKWNVSAIGRLVMIKWILPVYDWRYLYNARCLIGSSSSYGESHFESENSNPVDINSEACATCENFDKIDRVSNVVFNTLQNVYLYRDLPVIVTDSHSPWPNRENVSESFLDFLQSNTKLMDSTPCNVGTNLFQITLDKSPWLRSLFKQIDLSVAPEWFLHFRNCDFEAIKATRLILPYKLRPEYLSPHLPPYRSSWILLSQNYEMPKEKHLIVKDTVFVFQLSGQIAGKLQIRDDCSKICLDQEFELNAGEAFVFNAQMWNFYYRSVFQFGVNLTTTFIQEIEIN